MLRVAIVFFLFGLSAIRRFVLQKPGVAFGFRYAQVPVYFHTQLSYHWSENRLE
jgi:hypothetical protein